MRYFTTWCDTANIKIRINSNVQMTAFWMMAHMLHRLAFAAAIREEIAPAMESISRLDHVPAATIADITKQHLAVSCPLFNSAFHEVLRVSSTGSTVREAMRPTGIGGKTISAGTKVLIPQRQRFLAEEAFGPTSHEVDLSRFLKDKTLERNEYYQPFGGVSLFAVEDSLGRGRCWHLWPWLFGGTTWRFWHLGRKHSA